MKVCTTVRMSCKYYKWGYCYHPSASYCVNGSLWWPKGDNDTSWWDKHE